MENWKKEFIANYCEQEPKDWIRFKGVRVNEALAFIETKIIEKIIEEIPNNFDAYLASKHALRLKQQLKAKWLSKN